MLRILVPVTLLCAFLVTGTGTAASTTSQQLHAAQTTVVFFQNHNWLRAPRQENCLAVPWTGSCQIARRVFARDFRTVLKFKAQYSIPLTTNWTRAMRYAQRPFPGTYDWLEFISNRECRACYTTSAFICNYQGSGACGPMQFMSGTFYGHADDARAYLNSHGYVVDPAAWHWESQLGQALTAAYMRFTGQDGCHWCL